MHSHICASKKSSTIGRLMAEEAGSAGTVRASRELHISFCLRIHIYTSGAWLAPRRLFTPKHGSSRSELKLSVLLLTAWIVTRLEEGRKKKKDAGKSCTVCRWFVRNVLFLHHCLELVAPRWNISSGRTRNLLPPPPSLHHHCLSEMWQCDICPERPKWFLKRTLLLLLAQES